MSKPNCELYVVYRSNYDGYFGNKSFANKKQAVEYKALLDKTKSNRAIELSKQQIQNNKQNDRSCEYIVSKTLKNEFNTIVAEACSVYSCNEKEN